MSGESDKAEGSKAPPQERMNAVDLAKLAGMLHDFRAKRNEKGSSGVSAWLRNSRRILDRFGVPKDQWVTLATTKILPETDEAYDQWCSEGGEERQTWAGFEEFMVRHLIGAASGLDAFIRAQRMSLPTNETDVDKSLGELNSLVELTNIRSIEDYRIMQIVSKLPVSVIMQLLERPNGLQGLTVGTITALLQAHYAAKKVATCGEPMDVDLVRENVEETAGEGTSNVVALHRDQRHSTKATNSQQSAEGVIR
ncbi:hypothetical protein GGI13_002218 [Coemansia sp. RSA 455]|nr:hypothetical protein GGI13_002218 [Coemansia sp. RSA 455]